MRLYSFQANYCRRTDKSDTKRKNNFPFIRPGTPLRPAVPAACVSVRVCERPNEVRALEGRVCAEWNGPIGVCVDNGEAHSERWNGLPERSRSSWKTWSKCGSRPDPLQERRSVAAWLSAVRGAEPRPPSSPYLGRFNI